MIADYEILSRICSDGHIKGNKYLFFIKVGEANMLLKLNYLQNRVDTTHIYHTKQYQTFYRKIKCDLLSVRGVQNHQDFQNFIDSFYFFHEVVRLFAW